MKVNVAAPEAPEASAWADGHALERYSRQSTGMPVKVSTSQEEYNALWRNSRGHNAKEEDQVAQNPDPRSALTPEPGIRLAQAATHRRQWWRCRSRPASSAEPMRASSSFRARKECSYLPPASQQVAVCGLCQRPHREPVADSDISRRPLTDRSSAHRERRRPLWFLQALTRMTRASDLRQWSAQFRDWHWLRRAPPASE